MPNTLKAPMATAHELPIGTQQNMAPPKATSYRQNKTHDEFLNDFQNTLQSDLIS